jgi:hypothetical protein
MVTFFTDRSLAGAAALGEFIRPGIRRLLAKRAAVLAHQLAGQRTHDLARAIGPFGRRSGGRVGRDAGTDREKYEDWNESLSHVKAPCVLTEAIVGCEPWFKVKRDL